MFFKHSFNIADGSRLLESEHDRLWFVYGGKRHHVICQQVHGSLFAPEVSITRPSPLMLVDIMGGPDLMFGTSLVRREGGITIHFLAMHPKGAMLHPIPTKDIFDRCGFDLALCRTLPAKTFDQIKVGASFA